MSFVSDIGGMLLIDERNAAEFAVKLDGDGSFGRGWIPRDYNEEPTGSLGFAAPIDFPLIDESEWEERIKDGERQKNRIPDLCDMLDIRVKNQRRTNYCWINAPIHCMEILRAQQGLPHVSLSPASCGAPITNYANARGNPAGVGGWGTRGLKFLADEGAVPTSMWPDNEINRAYDTPQTRAIRSQFRCTEWWDLQPRNFKQMMTCLFMGKPVAGGLNYMGHEMTAVAPVKLDGHGRYGVIWDNSYGYEWGTKGRVVMDQARSTADDQVAPRTAIGS